jgi:large subunit ribosomal protein L13
MLNKPGMSPMQKARCWGDLPVALPKFCAANTSLFFTPHVDTGDHVVIVNAEKIQVKGNNKAQQKVYTSYSGYPGGLKKQTLEDALEKRPTFVLEHAIRGMLPHNKLGRQMIKKVRIYAGPEHPHQAQSPEPIDL